MFKTNSQRHCGRCSQCIDRKFATTALGLQAYDPDKDYVQDVFVGPRKDPLEKAIAVDYVRHGIELARRTETDLALSFNAEISRAVRHQPKRSEAAQKLISMHKRHGDTVSQVLVQKLHENTPALVRGDLDGTSLLAMVCSQHHLQERPGNAAEPFAQTDVLSVQNAALDFQSVAPRVEASLTSLHAKFDAIMSGKAKKKTKRKLRRRDTIIFAAIVKGKKGAEYCNFLNDHAIKPGWRDGRPASYPRAYELGEPWRKKVQDEKTRAQTRMKTYTKAELLNAFCAFLNTEFNELTTILNSRNSH
jgi:hypothetical protein